jgi:uncharacterized protein YecE (DUF72 family)
MTIHIGVGGWVFAPWRGTFYPEGLPQKQELRYAAERLTGIEINGTYYGAQKPESFARWRAEAPEGFVFALKGSRFVTNRRVLAEAGPSVEKFCASGIAELGDKLGPINWQLPPTKRFDAADIEAFLGLLPKTVGGVALRHAMEPRHESFRDAAFVDLCRDHGVAIITGADGEYPTITDLTAPFAYLRIMGTTADHEAGYAPKALDAWAKRAKALAKGEGLDDVAPAVAKPAKKTPRDVFLFVISGEKQRNPAAAMALIDRL